MADAEALEDPLAERDGQGRWLPLSRRKGWEDVEPVAQDEGANPPCPINYSPEFTETMSYFRAVLKAGEKSERALRLTKEVIGINAASYTAWHYRRQIVAAIGADAAQDRAWLDKMAEENPKNYQLWYHRRWVVDVLGDASHELAFTASVLEMDSKNYHAWAHRQWVLERYGLWEGELEWIDHMLASDRRNNSAWNQRFFVVSRHEGLASSLPLRRREIDYAWTWIRKSPNNQSPWSYLAAMTAGPAIDVARDFPELRGQLEDAASRYVTCAHVFSLLVDLYEKEATPAALNKAIEHCDALQQRLASSHEKYWAYRKAVLSDLLAKSSSNE